MNIYDIADKAGVSIATVSRVLNNKSCVSIKSIEKVNRVIEQTGYRPNSLARELSNKKTNVIGIVIPGVNNYFTERIEAISQISRENGYSIMITGNLKTSNKVHVEIENLNLLYDKQVDGIIFFVTKVTPEHIGTLKKISNKIPIILVDREIEDLELPSIVQENYLGARKAIKYLIEQGHKEIACIKGPTYDESATERFRAYIDILQENNLQLKEDYILKGTFSINSGYLEMKKLLEGNIKLPTAIFCANDNMAIGAMRAIAEKGKKVPDDISIIGFDDIEIGSFTYPALTTVNQDHYEVGKVAAETLIKFIQSNNINISKIVMEQKLVIRESVKKI